MRRAVQIAQPVHRTYSHVGLQILIALSSSINFSAIRFNKVECLLNEHDREWVLIDVKECLAQSEQAVRGVARGLAVGPLGFAMLQSFQRLLHFFLYLCLWIHAKHFAISVHEIEDNIQFHLAELQLKIIIAISWFLLLKLYLYDVTKDLHTASLSKSKSGDVASQQSYVTQASQCDEL